MISVQYYYEFSNNVLSKKAFHADGMPQTVRKAFYVTQHSDGVGHNAPPRTAVQM